MKLDRALQLDFLNRLADAYPKTVSVQAWTRESENANANLHYLAEHNLIDGSASNEMGGSKTFILAKITASGMDFLADDGGLSAILGVVTVKLHEDTIRQLLIGRIEASNVPMEERTSLVAAVRKLPSKALGALAEKLLEKGAEQMLENSPRLIALLTQLIAQ